MWIHLIISVAAIILCLAASWRNIMQDRNVFRHFPCFPFQFWLVMQYLSEMTEEQTLVMYSGHPLGLFPSHRYAPRLIITNGMVGVNILFFFSFFFFPPLWFIFQVSAELNIVRATWTYNSTPKNLGSKFCSICSSTVTLTSSRLICSDGENNSCLVRGFMFWLSLGYTYSWPKQLI